MSLFDIINCQPHFTKLGRSFKIVIPSWTNHTWKLDSLLNKDHQKLEKVLLDGKQGESSFVIIKKDGKELWETLRLLLTTLLSRVLKLLQLNGTYDAMQLLQF